MAELPTITQTISDTLAEIRSLAYAEGLAEISFEELRNRAVGALTPDSSLPPSGEVVDGLPAELRTRPTTLEGVEGIERDIVAVVDYLLAHADEVGGG